MNIAVIGTGYVGLATGTCFAETGNQVICMDVDTTKVEKMKQWQVPIYEPGLDILFERNTSQGRLRFTTSLEEAIEKAAGRKAQKEFLPIQPGDVTATFADVKELVADFDYQPNTDIQTGVQYFVDWYKSYYEVQ